MKTKTMIMALISRLFINAAPAGGSSVDVGYSTDHSATAKVCFIFYE